MPRSNYGHGGAPETAALKRLRRETKGTKQVEIAQALGVGQQMVSAILAQKCRPGAHIRAAIERVYGIPVGEWMTADERAIANGPRKSVAPQRAAS